MQLLTSFVAWKKDEDGRGIQIAFVFRKKPEIRKKIHLRFALTMKATLQASSADAATHYKTKQRRVSATYYAQYVSPI